LSEGRTRRSFGHDGPLDLLRKEPAQVPALLREALGLALPRFAAASPADSDFTQVRPASFYADLTVTLHGGRRRKPVMGIIVELQLRRDGRKRRSWPLYAAALHARLRCQICLVVIAPDPGVARWAAAPITTLQPGSPFTPLVIGPEEIPRVSRERAHREPWMAVLSALAHGNRPGGVAIALAAIDAISGLPDEHAKVCFDLIRESLDAAAARALENEMQHGKYEYKSDFARRYFGEGREKGRKEGIREGIREGRKEGRHEGQLETMRAVLQRLAKDRFGISSVHLRGPIEACADLGRLTALFSQINAAPDRRAVERLVAALGTGPSRAARHRRPRRARTARAPQGRARAALR
jgi:hypothetical protein